ncbi:putative BURP domain-containing protein [Medicago truncatula]|uniref:Putative BURP domain-containing protein n=1 Tax=Medicago truncatula TaxID=3880 RepID=A0A396I6I1_MEDTR|nr:putative BURP domain-containing protein [Medicago truncatula]
MRKTLEHCEADRVRGETRMCVNSVESMLKFVDTIIGSEAKYDILTTNNPSPSAIPL